MVKFLEFEKIGENRVIGLVRLYVGTAAPKGNVAVTVITENGHALWFGNSTAW